jgi:hypothetical protein
MAKRGNAKKPMTVDEWLKVQLDRQPVRGTPDPERCARVVEILATDYLERMVQGGAVTNADDQDPEGSDE